MVDTECCFPESNPRKNIFTSTFFSFPARPSELRSPLQTIFITFHLSKHAVPVLSKFSKPGVIISTNFRNLWNVPWEICHLLNPETKLISKQVPCWRNLKIKVIHSPWLFAGLPSYRMPQKCYNFKNMLRLEPL